MSKSIMQDKRECYITKKKYGLHKHHIYFGFANRRISEEHGFWVWLTPELHNMSNDGVHFNTAFDLSLKRECQKKYEETHSREEFMKLIGCNYLED